MTNFSDLQTFDQIPGLASAIQKETGISGIPINGKTYNINLLMGVVGLNIGLEIIKLVAPTVGSSVDGYINKDDLLQEKKTFLDIANTLVSRLGEVDTVSIIYTLLKGATCDGKPIDFDTHFRANYGDLIQLIVYALKENYESAFTESGLKARLLTLVSQVMGRDISSEELSELLKTTIKTQQSD